MADHSGQTTRERVKPVDASSTLTWFCEITTIYTNFQGKAPKRYLHLPGKAPKRYLHLCGY